MSSRARPNLARARLVAVPLAIAAALGAAGCVPAVAPRFPQSVAAALAQRPMRQLETAHLHLYYPEGRQEEAARFLAHIEGCVSYLKDVSHVHNSVADLKMIVILPELPYNNAFVLPRLAGYNTEAIIPTYATLDAFSLEMGLPPDAATIACHELTHYVHLQQIAGFAWFWNASFGAVYTPQTGLDSWFLEGLAVYYETKLQPGRGRLAWPYWRGMFAAGYAGHRINGGDLSIFQRDFHLGNNYLVGSAFVRFLADRYGEAKLWHLINVQARSIFFPLWVDLRFWQVYDKTLSTLIDEFADDVKAHLPARARPAGQRVVRPAGTSARYARAADGSEALITSDHDSPTRLMVWAPDGRLRVERDLTDVVPPRRLAVADATLVSGLEFSADARALYFVSVDLDATYQAARLYRYDLEAGTLTVVHPDLRGTGGSISPDGRRYLFSRADGDHHDLAVLDLAAGTIRVLFAEPHGAYVSQARFSPDGKRVAATEFDGARFRLALFDAESGRPLGIVPTGAGPVSDPSWVDDHRILYLGAAPTDVGFQIYLYDLAVGRPQRVSEAPYLAFQPRAVSGHAIRFLNREGWQWSLDEIPLPPPAVVAPPPPAVVAPVAPTATEPAAPEPAPAEPAPSGPAPVDPAAAEPAPPTEAPTALPPADAAPPEAVAPTPTTLPQQPPPVPSPVVHPPSVVPPPAIPPLPPSDQPYRSTDHLTLPVLFGPTVQTIGDQVSFGLMMTGNDRLSLHRWAIAGSYQTAGSGAPSVSAAYANRQLAPLTLELSAAQLEAHDVPPTPTGEPAPRNPAYTLFRRDRQVSFDATRAFYGNPIDLGFTLLETYQPDDRDVLIPLRRFAGPHLGASFVGEESTPYTGARRLFGAQGFVAVFPRQWNSPDLGFVDTRGELDAVVPIPGLRRHLLSFSLRARDLVGLPLNQNLLVVGGYTSLLLGRFANRPSLPTPDAPVVPPGLAFVEPLRGFEDHPLRTDRIFIADGAYRYPFIIDWGSASTLALLPALFISQLDLELFGAAASDARVGDRHLAAGGALTLELALWQVPFNFQYQIARRATDDHGLVQLLTLGL